jgi:SdrD B-like domain
MKRRFIFSLVTLVALAALLAATAGLAAAEEPPAPADTNVAVVQALVSVDGVLTDGINISLYSLNDDGSRNLVGTMASGGGAYMVWPWGTSYLTPELGGWQHGWVGWNALPTTHSDKDYVDYEVEIEVPAGLTAVNGTVQGGFEAGRVWMPGTAHPFCWGRQFEFTLESKPVEYKLDGYKFKDTNENGSMDADEVGIPDVTINLDGGDATAKTDENGYFSFTVEAGSHTVAVDESTAPGFYPTTPTSVVTSEGKTVYFGNAPYGSICGKKYNDKNKNGKPDCYEPGLQGVTIKLTGKTGAGNEEVSAEAVTAEDGRYCFTGLKAGTYTMTEVVPSGWYATGPNPLVVTLQPGQKVTGVDFFNAQGCVPYGSICGKKYNDKNKNGRHDCWESTVSGVKIKLSGVIDGQPVNKETLTSWDGSYSFTGLKAGTYTIAEVVPSGWQATGPVSIEVTLLPGQKITGVDFFNVRNSTCGWTFDFCLFSCWF